MLPIRLPERPRRVRDDLSAALARRVGPMLGVFDPSSPHRRSWVVDVAQVAPRELAQGFPGGPVAIRSTQDEEDVETPLSPTTMGKFGPNTTAALILEAADVLLVDYRDAIESILRFQIDVADRDAGPRADDGTTQVRTLLAMWAIAVGELWSSHPALLWSAIWARSSQRTELMYIRSPIRPTSAPAASEFGSPAARSWDYAPRTLGIVDDVLEMIRREGGRKTQQYEPVSDAAARVLRDAEDTLCSVIASIARVDGEHPAIVWIPPLPDESERVATAYVVTFAVAKEFFERLGMSHAAVRGVFPIDPANSPQVLAAAREELTPTAFSLYARIVEVAGEWASRGGDGGARGRGTVAESSSSSPVLSTAEHAAVQDALARALADRLRDGKEAAGRSPDHPVTAAEAADIEFARSAEPIVATAELRASACRLRLALLDASASGDEQNGVDLDRRVAVLQEESGELLRRLDLLSLQLSTRVIATGPGLVQLSRATSDLFAAYEWSTQQHGIANDAFWSDVYGKVGEYWTSYTSLLDESRPDREQNAVDHYLGNLAGYLRRSAEAKQTANPATALRQAFELYNRRIVPFREQQLRSRADWAGSWIGAVMAGVRCVVQLVDSLDGPSGGPATAFLSQAASWIARGERLLPTDVSSGVRDSLATAKAEVERSAARAGVPLDLAERDARTTQRSARVDASR